MNNFSRLCVSCINKCFRRFILWQFAVLVSAAAVAQYDNIEFIENKGQWNELVKYKGIINTGAFFLEQTGFRVLQHDPRDLEQITDIFHGPHDSAHAARAAAMPADPDRLVLHSHAYDVQFVNAGTPVISPDKALPTFNNYFIGNKPERWKSNCRIFQAVTYTGMYNNVDVRYYTDNGRLKYDIIVQPGGNVANVAMRYEGVSKLEVTDGQLIITTSVGESKELKPYAYQIINGLKKEVRCSFRVAKNTVSFIVDNYDKSAVLVIDPALVFVSFTGSSADNWGYTATYGQDGSFYAGGIVFGSGFPTSTGALQTTFNGGANDDENIGGYDMGIMKFNADGTRRIYATYLGGSGNEQPHSLVVNNQNELVLAGRSNSGNFPSTGLPIGPGGNYDIVLVKFNAAGNAIIGSRRIGGSAYDGVNIRPKYASPRGTESIRRNYGDDARSEVIFDANGDILVASNTQSPDFFTTGGAVQSNLRGRQDAVFIKMDPTLTNPIFITLLGGSNDDAAFVLAIHPGTGNIYVGGNTLSGDFPGDKTGVKFSSSQGNTDGFIAIFSPGGQLLKTTYIGTDGFDMLYGIQFDRFGFPYIMGTTTSIWPVTSNVGFSQRAGKQFISKLKDDLSDFVYSTVFGSGAQTPNISPIAFLVDRCENVYVSGWGGSANTTLNFQSAGTAGLTVTSNAIQRTTDNNDFYFFVLEKNAASQLFGSFFGQSGGYGEHVDGGTSRFDRSGVIYQAMCANCGRDVTFPTTPGVWARTNGSGQCNLAALKLAFNLSGVAGGVRAAIEGINNDTVGCLPLTVTFRDTLAEGKSYIWNFGDGTPNVSSTAPTISHTFTALGNFRVMMISIDSSKCNTSDTSYVTIRVKTDRADVAFVSKKLLPCDQFNHRFINKTVVVPPGKTFTNQSFRWEFGDNTPPVISGLDTVFHSFPAPGVYIVKLTLIDTNFCNAPVVLTDTLRIASLVKARFETPLLGCAPYLAYFNNTSDAGEEFFWDFGDGATSTAQYPTHLYPTPGTYTIKMTATDSGTCNRVDSVSVTITVADKPTSAFSYSPQPPQSNVPVDFVNLATGAVRYKWIFGDGEEFSTSSTQSVSHLYNSSNFFEAMLVAFNTKGCSDTAMQIIQARVDPLLDVPSAFTPNGDGINDIVKVRGFGIQKMTWRIYNRWGVLVFETNDRNRAWDGKYKGSIQPAEVYHYVLDVQYSDDKVIRKMGDITLIR